MAIDPKIEEAISEAVKEAGQSEAVARKLSAWMNAVTSGNEDVNNIQSARRHLDLLYEATHVSSSMEEML